MNPSFYKIENLNKYNIVKKYCDTNLYFKN